MLLWATGLKSLAFTSWHSVRNEILRDIPQVLKVNVWCILSVGFFVCLFFFLLLFFWTLVLINLFSLALSRWSVLVVMVV